MSINNGKQVFKYLVKQTFEVALALFVGVLTIMAFGGILGAVWALLFGSV